MLAILVGLDNVGHAIHVYVENNDIEAGGGDILSGDDFSLKAHVVSLARSRVSGLYNDATSEPSVKTLHWQVRGNPNSNCTIWFQDALTKVFKEPDRLDTKLRQSSIIIKAAKGEYEPFQLVIIPEKEMAGIELRFTDLVGPTVIHKDNIYYNRVEYVYVSVPSHPDIPTGYYPDPLPFEQSSLLTGGVNNPFWITVKTPIHIPAGIYKSAIEIFQDSQKISAIPLELKVWDFTVPEKTSVYASACLHNPFYHSFDQIEVLQQEYGDPIEVLKRYYKNLVDHRVKDYTHGNIIPDIEVDVSNPKNVVIDYTAFDEMAEYLEQIGMERYKFPACWTFGTHSLPVYPKWHFGNTDIQIFSDTSNTTFTPEFLNLFNQVYPAIYTHLQEKGWADKVVAMFVDEPNYAHAPTVNALINISQLFKDINSDINIRLTKYPYSSLYGLVDIWEVHSSHVESHLNNNRLRQQAGDEYSHYNNVSFLLDFPGMRLRTIGWRLWRFQLDGTLCWYRVADWHRNLWEEPHGGHRGLNGEGILLYPPRNSSEIGPINSIRWELLREGLEDYEYLYLLKQKTDQLQAIIDSSNLTGQQQDKYKLLVSESKGILSQVNKITWGFPYVYPKPEGKSALDQPYTLDVSLLRNIREKTAEQIERITAILQ